jgi:GrpB-like predicted nucleotidyltransferase (UPF0157 family)
MRQTEPGPLRQHDPAWREDYATVEAVVRAALLDRVLALEHVGSTVVAGLVAKPVIDIDLTVADVDDEPDYLPALERGGFRLVFRDELVGEPHRHLTFAGPDSNLHVWNPGAIEPRRHVLFATWLRSNPTDRRRYAEAKLAAAAAPPERGRYNDLKAAAVYEIYERAFRADSEHAHDPRPLR